MQFVGQMMKSTSAECLSNNLGQIFAFQFKDALVVLTNNSAAGVYNVLTHQRCYLQRR